MALVGLMYTIIGLMVMLFGQIANTYTKELESAGFLISFLGILVMFYSYMVREFSKMRTNQKSHLITEYDIVCKWRELEIACRNYVGKDEQYSLHSVIYELQRQKMLNDEDVIALDKLRDARNSIVHATNEKKKYTQQELRQLFKQIDYIEEKI